MGRLFVLIWIEFVYMILIEYDSVWFLVVDLVFDFVCGMLVADC